MNMSNWVIATRPDGRKIMVNLDNVFAIRPARNNGYLIESVDRDMYLEASDITTLKEDGLKGIWGDLNG